MGELNRRNSSGSFIPLKFGRERKQLNNPTLVSNSRTAVNRRRKEASDVLMSAGSSRY
jgi:hypothetical protein